MKTTDHLSDLIKSLRLLANTVGLSPEGTELLRTLADVPSELRTQLRQLAA